MPYGVGDAHLWRALVREHQFSEPRVEWLTLEVRSPTAQQLAIGLVHGTPMSNAIRARGGDFEPIVEAVAEALARHGGQAPFRDTMRALVITATAR
jgi:hypothetical protein